MEKYRTLRLRLLKEGIVKNNELHEAQLIDPNLLTLVHSKEYVEGFIHGTLDKKVIRRIGLPWSKSFVRRSLASKGGTLQAALIAYQEGIGANLAGGTHHASRDFGEGFCVFNDIAIAIAVLLEQKKIFKAAVIDLDVHQGNGTASIFAEDDRVYILDMFGEKNYPYRKIPATRSIPLEDDCTDAEYLSLLEQEFAAIQSFSPDIIIYQAGVDALKFDSLGRLSLSYEALEQRDRMVFEFARFINVPLVLTLGGGYSKPIDASVEAYTRTYKALKSVYADT
jgi:acetoin utilization deacetylase AcuC-like enzyme